ncbi:arylsulfatase [Achromobacter sp. RTa]|uniref:arylsulfatase n=1 Tax=Achromobacter sp. RTa TaxID=1532557 RepID=UPI00050DBEFB|nr:arylsulfatase [Achromobacter sp. RTa]KGD86827.1 arylsulfatase [Achromobacter sp. RTa]
MKAARWLGAALMAAGSLALTAGAHAQGAPAKGQEPGKKPNILVIFGDDIGQANISTYTKGVVGYRTPNIDRIANEGLTFTDYYAENSCTAGRSTFITGQVPRRTGLSKVGMPGAPVGLQDRDITIAQALKAHGYVTAQFGKNHLGDRDEYLPTKHGFDEFFGNLYHLNAEEEPERPYWPKNSTDPIIKSYQPRGVIKASADGKIQDTGALTAKRMETIDDETVGAALDYLDKHGKGDKPFFLWMNTTRMHVFTHIRPEHQGKSGMPGNDYADGMWEHDQDVGKLLKKLDDLGIADDTIVIYTTDNGPNQFSWPDAATTAFRNEKNSNWEGAYRVPAMIRWPGHIPAGEVKTGIVSGLDWFPTLLAAVGDMDVKERLRKGWTPNGANKSYKVHLDGYNQLDYLTGKTPDSAREDFYYFNDDGMLVAMRYRDWKAVFCEQQSPGGFAVWKDPFVCLRVPKLFNLRMDPYERADVVSDQYYDWLVKNDYLVLIASMKAAQFLQTFIEYPPSQRPASFSVDQVQAEVDRAIEKHFEEASKQQGK